MRAHIISLLATARKTLLSLNRGATRYIELQLDTSANDDLFISVDGLRRRIDSVQRRLEQVSGPGDVSTVVRLIALALALDPLDSRIESWLVRVPELVPLVEAFRAHRLGDSASLLALDPKEYLTSLHPLSLVAWAKALLAEASDRPLDTHVLLEAAIERSPALVATYGALRQLRHAQQDDFGEALAREAEELLSGRTPLYSAREAR